MASLNPSQVTNFTFAGRTATNQAVTSMIVPPDGGWGWVIVLIGFLSAVLMDGITYCFFLFREPMVLSLGIEPADISFLSALFTGFYFFGGILACSVGNYFGFRIVMILGATIVSLSFASGYVLQEIKYYYIIIGFIGGTSAGFILVAANLPPGFYFDKKRSIAMGLVSCGSGVGAIVGPKVATVVMDHYGWRNTFLFFAGIISLLILLGLLIRPLKPVIVIIQPGSYTTLRMSAREMVQHEQPTDYSLFRIPTLDTPSHISFGASSLLVRSTIINPSDYPTISQMAQDADAISIMVPGQSRQFNRILEMTQSRDVQASASMLLPGVMVQREEPLPRPWYYWCCCGCLRHPTVPQQPLLRTDLYYTGSLHRLDEYTKKDKDLDYHLHVTKVPKYFENLQDLTRTYTSWCCIHILHGLKSLLDYTLLKSPTFVCLAICALCSYVAFYIPFLYGKLHLKQIGKAEHATTLTSMIGLGNTIGRISSGIIVTTIPHFGARTLVMVFDIIAGFTILCTTFHPNITYQFTCMIIYGFTVGVFAPLRSIIVVDFFGLNHLTSATGILILFQGMGSLLGGPLAELAISCSGTYNAPFYVTATFLACAGLSLFPMRRLQNWEKKRKIKKTLSRQ